MSGITAVIVLIIAGVFTAVTTAATSVIIEIHVVNIIQINYSVIIPCAVKTAGTIVVMR